MHSVIVPLRLFGRQIWIALAARLSTHDIYNLLLTGDRLVRYHLPNSKKHQKLSTRDNIFVAPLLMMGSLESLTLLTAQSSRVFEYCARYLPKAQLLTSLDLNRLYDIPFELPVTLQHFTVRAICWKDVLDFGNLPSFKNVKLLSFYIGGGLSIVVKELLRRVAACSRSSLSKLTVRSYNVVSYSDFENLQELDITESALVHGVVEFGQQLFLPTVSLLTIRGDRATDVSSLKRSLATVGQNLEKIELRGFKKSRLEIPKLKNLKIIQTRACTSLKLIISESKKYLHYISDHDMPEIRLPFGSHLQKITVENLTLPSVASLWTRPIDWPSLKCMLINGPNPMVDWSRFCLATNLSRLEISSDNLSIFEDQPLDILTKHFVRLVDLDISISTFTPPLPFTIPQTITSLALEVQQPPLVKNWSLPWLPNLRHLQLVGFRFGSNLLKNVTRTHLEQFDFNSASAADWPSLEEQSIRIRSNYVWVQFLNDKYERSSILLEQIFDNCSLQHVSDNARYELDIIRLTTRIPAGGNADLSGD